jgi:hypothetical protein
MPVAPAASDQILMPAQQRLGLGEQPVPAPARQQPGEPSQHRTVGPVQPGSGHLRPQHLDLVAQHEQLRVLGRRAPRQQHQPSQQLAEDQIEQSKRHPPVICAGASLGEVTARAYDRPTGTHRHSARYASLAAPEDLGGRCRKHYPTEPRAARTGSSQATSDFAHPSGCRRRAASSHTDSLAARTRSPPMQQCRWSFTVVVARPRRR